MEQGLKNKKIAITGGAGVMGKRLVEKFLAQGATLRVMVLPNDPVAEIWHPEGVDFFYGDVSKPESIQGFCKDCDIVYHLAAIILSPLNPHLFWSVNYQGTLNVYQEALAHGVQQFIYISSASVTYPKPNAYSKSKLAAENFIIRESKIPYTIFRPTLAYEEGGAEEILRFAKHLIKYPIVPFIGSGKSLKAPVHVADLIQAMVAAGGNEKAHNKAYNLAGSESVTMKEMAQLILDKIGQKKKILPIPIAVCRALSLANSIVCKIRNKKSDFTWQTISGVTQNANLDISAAQRDLNYNPIGFREGLAKLNYLLPE